MKNKDHIVFDAFGTLFQTSSFIEELTEMVGPKAHSLIDLWRRKQLEYTWLYNQMDRYLPFDQITAKALETCMRAFQLENSSIPLLLLPLYNYPVLIDDASETLSNLKAHGLQLSILSNGTMPMLVNGVKKTGLADVMDHIFSVDQIKTYKPNPKVYQMAIDNLGCSLDSCLFVSSNQWDIAGANNFGLSAIWVNQYNLSKEALPFDQMTEVRQLRDLLSLL